MTTRQTITLEQLWAYCKCNSTHKAWLDPWGRYNNVTIFEKHNGTHKTIRTFMLEEGWFGKFKTTAAYKKRKRLPK